MYFSISFFSFHLSPLHPPIGDRREDFPDSLNMICRRLRFSSLTCRGMSAEKLSLEIFRKSPTGNVTSFSSDVASNLKNLSMCPRATKIFLVCIHLSLINFHLKLPEINGCWIYLWRIYRSHPLVVNCENKKDAIPPLDLRSAFEILSINWISSGATLSTIT